MQCGESSVPEVIKHSHDSVRSAKVHGLDCSPCLCHCIHTGSGSLTAFSEVS